MGATVIQCIIAAIIGGTLFGFGIGFVPIYSTFFTLSRNCTHFTGEAACHSVQVGAVPSTYHPKVGPYLAHNVITLP
jgi:hypothetical protein